MTYTRTRVKICGITRTEDAAAAVALGADMVGFILFAESPRYVNGADRLRILADAAGPLVKRVGVVPPGRALSAAEAGSLTAAQVYDDEPRGALARIRVVRVRNSASVVEAVAASRRPGIAAILLDTWTADRMGGSGEPFPLALAAAAREAAACPVILAGGLKPETVEAAVRAVRPWAVDVSSGVEASPGVKDPARLEAFFAAVRRADSVL